MSSLFWGNNRQLMPVCDKMISSWVRKVLHIAKAHAVVLAAFVAGVFLLFILQAGDWARDYSPARHYFSTDISNTDWHEDSVQQAFLGLCE